MARKRIQDEFAAFFDYIRATGRVSPGVGKAYASYLRRIYRELDGNIYDPIAVNNFFSHAYLNDDGYPRLRSAWGMYCEYYATVKGETLPSIQSANLIKAKTNAEEPRVPSLSPAMRQALRTLDANSLSMHAVCQLTWAHVSIKEIHANPVTHVKTPGKAELWLIPSETMKVLYTYAQPGPNLYRPLVPLTPTSDEPYPYTALRREMHIVPEEEQDTWQQGKDSALGAALARTSRRPHEVEETDTPKHTTKDLLDLLEKPSSMTPAKSHVPLRVVRDDEDEQTEFASTKKKPSLSDVMGYDPNSDD